MAKEVTQKQKRIVLPEVDMQGRILPQALEFEEAVLGAMMLEPNAASAVIDSLREEMFYKESHQKIYKAIKEVFLTKDPIDLLSVANQLRKNEDLEAIGGAYYLSSLTNRIVSSANIEYHARIVVEKFIQRKLISVSTEVIHNAYDPTMDVLEMLDKAEQNLFDIAEQNFRRDSRKMDDLIREVLRDLENTKNSDTKLRGLPSGFTELDRVTNGWQRANLVIIAARPGMGKTAFVLSMARHIAIEQNKPIAFFSLEMSASDLALRLISAESGFKQNVLKNGTLSDDDWLTLVNKMTELEKAKLIIDDTAALSIFELRAKCRRFKQQHDIQAVIIDYLQLMSAGGDLKGMNREQEISTISRSLKALSKELDIPVIALSQLSRAVETRSTASKRPQLSDLRESGAIEQDADLVLFIYRPEYYKLNEFEDHTPAEGLAEIMIAKHRNGALKDIKLRFIADYAKFVDYDENLSELPSNFVPLSSLSEDRYSIMSSRINEEESEDTSLLRLSIRLLIPTMTKTHFKNETKNNNMIHIQDYNFKDKKVLLRVDYNVPLSEKFEIEDATRIDASLPTINKILDDGGSVIILSHLGRPKGVEKKYSLEHVLPYLQKKVDVKVFFANDAIGKEAQRLVDTLPSRKILLLENLRFHEEETKGDVEFAEKLASYGDVYVNDAFSAAHRKHASTAVIAQFFPKNKMFGFLMQKEIDNLNKVLLNPKLPLRRY